MGERGRVGSGDFTGPGGRGGKQHPTVAPTPRPRSQPWLFRVLPILGFVGQIRSWHCHLFPQCPLPPRHPSRDPPTSLLDGRGVGGKPSALTTPGPGDPCAGLLCLGVLYQRCSNWGTQLRGCTESNPLPAFRGESGQSLVYIKQTGNKRQNSHALPYTVPAGPTPI